MWVVSADQLVNAIFLLVVSGALATLMWKTSNDSRAELKAEIQGLRSESKADIQELRTERKADNVSLRAEMASLRTEVKEEIQGLRTEFKAEIQGLRAEVRDLRGEFAIMRSDLTQVALAVGVQKRASGS
jgi:uncharacterized protein involved in exopolysaccharide biosynthesis